MQQQEDRLGFVSIPLSFRTAGSRAASSLTRCTLRTESQYLDLSVPGLKAFISKPTAQGDEARDRGVILMSDIIGHTDARTQRVAESVAAAGFTTG